jgi:AcrR family transcriptional regulator
MARWKPDAQGRLMKAAMELFAERGYDATTVMEIAEHAGLTKRTFFRHFADKREVLFSGYEQLAEVWLAGVAAAPADAEPLAIVTAGFEPLAEMFKERLEFARVRAQIIAANPELMERELIKLQSLASELKRALLARGVALNAAILASQAGVTVFHVAFARWVEQDDPASLGRLLAESLEELREVAAMIPPPAST